VLLLFDIDGTLLRGAAEAHRDAIYAALHAVHGVDAARVPSVATAGRTDGEIARAILLVAGVSATAIDERADDVRAECCRAYAELSQADLSHTVLPGNRELLQWCTAQPAVKLALVTGNYEPVARIKLTRAGLGHFFPAGQGGFGSDCEDRAALPPIARRRAGSDGISYPRARTIVIGDTPRDIACAHADGLRCLAVTTGPVDPAELVAADHVVDDAGELRALLQDALHASR
jgi:phosphoglycolate phosphatase-like HAD superfamily hydrolase